MLSDKGNRDIKNTIFKAVEFLRGHHKFYIVTRQKYIYFLLASSGAGIFVGLNQTNGLSLNCSQIPMFLGFISWGVSFYFGCKSIETLSELDSNSLAVLGGIAGALASVLETDEPDVFKAELLQEAFEIDFPKLEFWKQEKAISEKLCLSQLWQFRFLILGGCFYICWHIFEMYLRTITNP
jgi:hypothetical protein